MQGLDHSLSFRIGKENWTFCLSSVWGTGGWDIKTSLLLLVFLKAVWVIAGLTVPGGDARNRKTN